jgi:sulfonate transport system substrate-binding protein
MITRRDILGGALVLAALAISPAHAQDKPAEIRIGTQKGGFISAVRQRHAVEDAFKPLGIEIKWIDFQFGPPLLEAINVGSVDFGYVGDSPPIFAQAGGARIRYVAVVKSEGNTQAIIVPQDSPIKTLADLKGKRVAFGKGSSAHNLLIAALEKADLSWSDITPAPLAPADATAAFVKGSVDAWSIWDPYLALAELKQKARVIAFGKDVHTANAFFIVPRISWRNIPCWLRGLTPSSHPKADGPTSITRRSRRRRPRRPVSTSKPSGVSSTARTSVLFRLMMTQSGINRLLPIALHALA